MGKVNDLLSKRFAKKEEKSSKMGNLAELSSSGKLSSFAGVFRVAPLGEEEEISLRSLLQTHVKQESELERDLQDLSAITSEVNAITNQAAILHGERIKRAQFLFKKYKEGAFSAWLVQVYGNRQTPYNFLQYYELYTSLSERLKSKLDAMPRQAVYVLASRNGEREKKEKIIASYAGEPKKQLLENIRKCFPLALGDKRERSAAGFVIKNLKTIEQALKEKKPRLTLLEQRELKEILDSIQSHLGF